MEFHFGYLGANYTWQEGRLRPVCSPIVLVLFSGYSETTGLSPAPQQGKLLCLPQLSPQIKLSLLSDFPLLYPASCGHCRPRHCGRLSPDSLNRSCCPQISKMSVSNHRYSSHDGTLAYHWMIEAAAQWISFPLLSYYAGVTVISYPFIGFMNYHNCELALLLGLPVFHQRCQTSLPGDYGCYPESSLPLPPHLQLRLRDISTFLFSYITCLSRVIILFMIPYVLLCIFQIKTVLLPSLSYSESHQKASNPLHSRSLSLACNFNELNCLLMVRN